MLDFTKNGSLNFIKAEKIKYDGGEFLKVTGKFSWLSEIPKHRKEKKYNSLWIEATGSTAEFINQYFNDKDYVLIQGNIETYSNPDTQKQTVKLVVSNIRNLTKDDVPPATDNDSNDDMSAYEIYQESQRRRAEQE